MVYNVHDVMRDVRVCLDQNMTSEQLLHTDDVDTLAVDDIIRSKLTEGVDMAHSMAPAHMLEEGHTFGDAVYWGDQESGWVLLPDDFMRLIVFEMSDWSRPVVAAISSTDPAYSLQRQRVKALRGTAERPVCAIVNRQEGKALEFYSCRSQEAYVRQGLYVPYSHIDADDGIDVSERCYRGAVYAAAGLAALTLGDRDMSNAMMEMARNILE